MRTSQALLPILLIPYSAQAQDLAPAWGGRMGSSGNDAGTAIALDDAGNVHTAGYFSGTMDMDLGACVLSLTSAGASDIYIAKYDSGGVLLWAKALREGLYLVRLRTLGHEPLSSRIVLRR